MEITEVRVKLVSPGNDKLRAFCSITIDNNFVVRDLKIIEGPKGPFVAMPSRKLTDRCPRCGGKNHHRASYCNNCGSRLPGDRAHRRGGREKLHADVAHPINSDCREMIQNRILDVYEEEQSRSAQPGYKPMELDVFEQDYLSDFVAESRPGDTTEAEPRLRTAKERPLETADHLAAGDSAEGGDEGIEGEDSFARKERDAELSTQEASGSAPMRGGNGQETRSWFKRDPRRSRGRRRESEPAEVPASTLEARTDESTGDEHGRQRSAREEAVRLGEDAFRRKQRLAEELELDVEPEDNFGAGLFS